MTYSFTMPAAGSAMKVPAATPETTRYTTRADMQDCIPWHGQRTGCLFYVNRHKLASVIVLSSFHAQSSFCLLQNRRPESQSPTFRRPSDRGYNTLDFASKIRVPKRGVAPFGFPHHFRFSDTKTTLPVLHPCPGNLKVFLAILRKRGSWCSIFN